MQPTAQAVGALTPQMKAPKRAKENRPCARLCEKTQIAYHKAPKLLTKTRKTITLAPMPQQTHPETTSAEDCAAFLSLPRPSGLMPP